MNSGVIVSIKDLVVRVQFDGNAPEVGEVIFAQN